MTQGSFSLGMIADFLSRETAHVLFPRPIVVMSVAYDRALHRLPGHCRLPELNDDRSTAPHILGV
jgi:hypothetical protein